jgi:hypothetical protein
MLKTGDNVHDRDGRPGRVTRVYNDFIAISWCEWPTMGEAWVDRQLMSFPAWSISERFPWAVVELETGEIIWSPLAMLTARPSPK